MSTNTPTYELRPTPATAGHPDALELVRDGERVAILDAATVDVMARGFMTAALWADGIPVDMTDSGEAGGLQHLDPRPAMVEWARTVCARFLAVARDDVQAHMDAFPDPDGGDAAEYVGHTLYLDAAGHGVAFTDRAWRDDDPMTIVCSRLNSATRTLDGVEHVAIFDQGDGTADVS